MSERVLFVDDEPNVLGGIERSLRKQVDLRTAPSGAEGLVLPREGGPYHFPNKPCPAEQLLGAVADGLKQHWLITAEKVVLQQLLSGAVKMLIEILGMVMILNEDLVSPKGMRLVPAGQEVTRTLIVRLSSIVDGVGVAEPFRVRVSS